MVLELTYKRPSALVEAKVYLEPEQAHEPFYFQAELADPQLIAELFYRLHLVSAIKVGRSPFAESGVGTGSRRPLRRWWYYDPLITVADGQVSFETFSLDMAHYARVDLGESAFRHVEHWTKGVTNVDFSKEFIAQIRANQASLRNIIVDPEGLEVQSDRDALIEKKIPLPESWEIALKSIRGLFEGGAPAGAKKETKLDKKFFPQTFLKAFSSRSGTVWQHQDTWEVAQVPLRRELGVLYIATTKDTRQRFDGRLNVDFAAVRDATALRRVKSYFLRAEPLDKDHFRVVGDTMAHYVTLGWGPHSGRRRWVCDCPDFMDRGVDLCKHLIAASLPKASVVPVDEGLWTVTSDGAGGEHAVTLVENKFACECGEFQKYNICQHVVAVQREVGDYQYEEVKGDLTHNKPNVDEAVTIADITVDPSTKLEEAIRQVAAALFSNAKVVRIGGKEFPVIGQVGTKKLRHVEFNIGSVAYRAMEQNPAKGSRWAARARAGANVVWVWRYGQYYARLVDGHFTYL